jgi:hypothetical protein
MINTRLLKLAGWTKDQQNELISFLEHERHKILLFNGGRFYINIRVQTEKQDYEKNVFLRGLVPFINDIFFPKYNYSHATKYVAPLKRSRSKINRKKQYDKGILVTKKNKFDGIMTGDLVHGQITTYFNSDFNRFKKIHPVIHEWTKRILSSLTEWDWIPIVSEFPCFNRIIGVASRTDFICAGKHGKIIFIELKTGYDDTFLCSSGKMNLMPSWGDCPKNQAMLQCTFSMLMTTEEHLEIRDKCECWVIRVGDTGTDRYECKNMDRISFVYNSLCKRDKSTSMYM